ncbi:MAG: MBL fold metallo-hydrolase [Terracidiphilus sp.]
MTAHPLQSWWRRAGIAFFLPICLRLALPAQTVVTLVGTGGPELTPERLGEATLIQTGGQTLLFDAGRGVLDGLYQSRIPPQQVTRIFLTHLHSDHIEGLPGLWITPWFLLGRTTPLEIWGPPGTAAMVAGMRAMFAHDLESRPNANLSRESLDIRVHEIGPGLVYDRDGLRVTAIPVEHGDGNPAFAYRVDTSDSAILLTGDCTLSGALAKATGPLDLTIANVAAAGADLQAVPRLKPILAKLMSPEQAAQLFRNTAPRLAVYSHIVKKGLAGAAGDSRIVERTRAAGYSGPLLMGTDHTRIVLGRPIRIEHPSGRPPDFDGPDSHF